MILHCAGPRLRDCTGRGVRIAVVDSGAVVGHPHLPSVASGACVVGETVTADYADRLGHGTAVAAAIHEKAPNAELIAVRVFCDQLTADAATLAHAIDWAADQGVRLINLSLGTPNIEHEVVLAKAVAHAHQRGALVVAALEAEGREMYPGAFAHECIVPVVEDAGLARDSIQTFWRGGRRVAAASPLPRPIPGVPPERNISGTSFAVANVTGTLALLLEDVRDAGRAVTRVWLDAHDCA